MPDASPVKWHLAHTTWFFETFLLQPHKSGYQAFHPDFRFLFNSYYNAVGRQYPRPCRGLLTRPKLAEVYAYRAAVDSAVEQFFESYADALPPSTDAVIQLGLNHEQQHQELILTDLKHALAQNPLRPAYRADLATSSDSPAAPLEWRSYPGGVHWIGHDGTGFSFDNERPRHRVYLEGFALASRPVTSGEYIEFIADCGYARPELWLSEGWHCAQSQRWEAPLYWEQRDRSWWTITLGGLCRVRPGEPVCHVSYYEADAYARWRRARLPTEFEWEIAACTQPLPLNGNFLECDHLHPTIAEPGPGLVQCFGDVWEWTRSPYTAYPGMHPESGALGEYNAKFMCNQLVLRGGSCATPRSHIRPTYRNFFPPEARWQFSGIRLARN
jgi:ergothioneine biosynthesis protein EgtB